MRMTCILTSHRKPRWVHEAIGSVLTQRHEDWHLILVDSGDLFQAGEFQRYAADCRVCVTTSDETEELRSKVCIQSWCVNEVFRGGGVTEGLVCYLPDDDFYYPDAFAAWNAAAEAHPDRLAWWGAADLAEVCKDGTERRLGIMPNFFGQWERAGIGGRSLYTLGDGMQVAHRTSLVCPWPESRQDVWRTPDHLPACDAVWLDRLGALATIYPLGVTVGRHRHTPDSRFTRPKC